MTTAGGEVNGRTLHLIDLENLVGDGAANGETALRVLAQYLDLACWREGDLAYVATNPGLASRICWDIPVQCNFRTACGPDGADHALLREAAPDFVARRVQRLVIGSGDHIFIQRALAVRDLGVGVAVVARRGSIHSGWAAWGFPAIELADAVPNGRRTVVRPAAQPRRLAARRREPVPAA